MAHHSQSTESIISELNTNKDKGLTSKEVEARRHEFGMNVLESTGKRGLASMIFDQFKDFTVIILMIAAVLSIFLKELIDGVVILGIVALNAGLGAYQENKASNALEALKRMASPKAKVYRDGTLIEVETPELVPGDLVKLDTGDYVPADLRLIDSVNLKIDESALTGESVASEKDHEAILPEDAPIGDRVNAAYSGTIVTYGYSKGIVVHTGMKTEIGKIATMLNETEDEMTPLQLKLAEFGKMLGIACLTVSGLIIVLGFLRKQEMLEIFMTAVSLAVAAIPEGLPAVVTTVLALGMQRMVKRHAIMKRLSAVETLGSTTVICSDKTGTLTQNKMTVQKFYMDHKIMDVTGTGYSFEGTVENAPDHAELIYRVAALCNDAEIEDEKCIGDPTEGALVVLAAKGGVDYKQLRKNHPRVDEFPFDSDRKLMSTVHIIDGKRTMLTKGATDELISRCDHIMIDGTQIPFAEEKKQEVLSQNNTFASEALRVIGYAMKTLGDSEKANTSENAMTFLGMTGMIDPPREEAIEAIKTCKKAGIRVIMITGDHITTASAIAMQMGIISSKEEAIEGASINSIDETGLIERLKHTNVFARVSPEHKVRIVKALKADDAVVAMTGDGVNDAPALKAADIGVAMGIAGTDVSKEAADMILTDDNFASIVSAVEEGRIIYSNIRKFVGFLLSCNIGEILIILIAMLANWGVPLVPIQLLWVNLITDSLPAFALGVEKGEKSIMLRKPRSTDEPIIDKKMAFSIGFQSIGLAVAVLTAFRIGMMLSSSTSGDGLTLGRTFAFSTLIFGELMRAYSARREDQFLWQYNIFSNRFLNMSVLVAVTLLMLVIYIPALQVIFKTTALAPMHLMIVVVLGVLPIVFGEVAKRFK